MSIYTPISRILLLPSLIVLTLSGCAPDNRDAADSTQDPRTPSPAHRSGMFPCTDQLVVHNLLPDTTRLRSGRLLYYTGDCDSVRLILEDAGQQHVVTYFDPDALPYHYRLAHHLVEDLGSTLLFRWGCPASSGCLYALHDARTGALIADLPELLEAFADRDDPFLLYIDTAVSDRGTYDTLAFYRLADRTVYRVPTEPGFPDHVRRLWGSYLIDSIAIERDSVVLEIGWSREDGNLNERRAVEIPFSHRLAAGPSDRFPASLLRNQHCEPLLNDGSRQWFVCRPIDRQGAVASFVWVSGSSSGVVPGNEMTSTPYIYPVGKHSFYTYASRGCADRSGETWLIRLDTAGLDPRAVLSFDYLDCEGPYEVTARWLASGTDEIEVEYLPIPKMPFDADREHLATLWAHALATGDITIEGPSTCCPEFDSLPLLDSIEQMEVVMSPIDKRVRE